jgi:hypothetical protein
LCLAYALDVTLISLAFTSMLGDMIPQSDSSYGVSKAKQYPGKPFEHIVVQ